MLSQKCPEIHHQKCRLVLANQITNYCDVVLYALNRRLSSKQLRAFYFTLGQQPFRPLLANITQLSSLNSGIRRAVCEDHRLIKLQVLAKVLYYIVALVRPRQHTAVI